MSVEENKKIVRRYIEDIINTGNVEDIQKYIAADYVEIHEGIRHEVGIPGAIEHVLGVRTTYPDLTVTVDDQFGEGDRVATCITARGTHLGSWLGMKPTGKKLTFTGVNINRLKDGKIVEHGGAANMMGPLLEAGALKVVGA